MRLEDIHLSLPVYLAGANFLQQWAMGTIGQGPATASSSSLPTHTTTAVDSGRAHVRLRLLFLWFLSPTSAHLRSLEEQMHELLILSMFAFVRHQLAPVLLLLLAVAR